MRLTHRQYRSRRQNARELLPVVDSKLQLVGAVASWLHQNEEQAVKARPAPVIGENIVPVTTNEPGMTLCDILTRYLGSGSQGARGL
jgi:hypothetical protein